MKGVTKIFYVLLFGLIFLSLEECATYGEKGLVDFNITYSKRIPINPKYLIERISENSYSITLHQGSALLSPGNIRLNYLRQAADTIAHDIAEREKKRIEKIEYIPQADSGWVHLVCRLDLAEFTEDEVDKNQPTTEVITTGTGFWVSSTGHLVSAWHIVEEARKIYAFYEDKQLALNIVAKDAANDLVLLKAQTSSTPVDIGYDLNIEKGIEVYTIGFPMVGIQGQESKVTFGHINSLSGIQDDYRYYQIDTPIQPGNSGGPLFTKSGKVAGIIHSSLSTMNVAKAVGALPQNINYAIKIAYLKPLIIQFMNDNKYTNKGTKSISELEKSVVMIWALK